MQISTRWICGNTRRDRVWNDDIRERLGVAPVEKKFVQHHLRWFGHIQRRPTEATVHSGVIKWSGNKKRDRGRSNLIWEESVKRDLKDWCITNELVLDRREWKLTIHMPKPWSSIPFFIVFCKKKIPTPFHFLFWLSILLSFLLLSNWFLFLSSFIFPLLFWYCFIHVSLAHAISSLTYPNLFEIKRLDYCCCCIQISTRRHSGLVLLVLLWVIASYSSLTAYGLTRAYAGSESESDPSETGGACDCHYRKQVISVGGACWWKLKKKTYFSIAKRLMKIALLFRS
jgi:hypothetical protein